MDVSPVYQEVVWLESCSQYLDAMAPLLASDEAKSRVLPRRVARLGRFVRRPLRKTKRVSV